jgi:hypothetical protein
MVMSESHVIEKGQKALISGGYWNPLGKWKIGDTVTVKEVFEDSVTVEEFFGRLPKNEIQILNK